MNFGQEFVTLFRNMPIASIICLIVGLIFVVIEIFQPGFGIFGILGGVLSVVGIVLRAIVGDGNVFIQIVIIVVLDIIIFGIAFVLMFIASKKGWLKHSPLVQYKTAVNVGHSDGTMDFSCIVGKIGVATTDLHPIGKARIDGKVYDVVSDEFFINKDSEIVVTGVEGAKIIVKNSK